MPIRSSPPPAPTTAASATSIDLERLLSHGYFPKEYPPPFSTTSFAAHAAKGLQITKPTGQGSLVTHPAVHNLARPGGTRRRLHIPNPFSQLSVAKLLVD